MSKLNELSVKKEVAHQLAMGKTQTDIAKQVGVTQQAVSQLASKDEIKQLIEEERGNFVRVLPDAVQNVKDLVEEMPSLAKDDIENRKLSYNASKDVLKATSILPTNQYAQNIYNDNRRQTLMTPEFEEMLDIVEARQIEAEYIEEQKSPEGTPHKGMYIAKENNDTVNVHPVHGSTSSDNQN